MIKLGARDRAQLVVFAYETGLVTPGWTPDPSPRHRAPVGTVTAMTIPTRTLGPDGSTVGAIGLGCMSFSPVVRRASRASTRPR